MAKDDPERTRGSSVSYMQFGVAQSEPTYVITSSNAYAVFSNFTNKRGQQRLTVEMNKFTRYLFFWLTYGWFGQLPNLVLETENHCTPLKEDFPSCQEQKSMALLKQYAF